VNRRVIIPRFISQLMVQTLGTDLGLRLRDKVVATLTSAAERHQGNRYAEDPSCFQFWLPVVARDKGGWYHCTFVVNDQNPEEFHIEGTAIEFRAIGPM